MIACPDTSPLLVLARIDRLKLLGDPPSVILSRVVLNEVREKQDAATTRIEHLAAACREIVDPEMPGFIDPDHTLGPDERSVLAWAASSRANALCIFDDSSARALARRLGLALTGTLGLVLRAKKDGHVVAAAPLLREAVEAGLYLDDAVIAAALSRVGEHWPGPK